MADISKIFGYGSLNIIFKDLFKEMYQRIDDTIQNEENKEINLDDILSENKILDYKNKYNEFIDKGEDYLFDFFNTFLLPDIKEKSGDEEIKHSIEIKPENKQDPSYTKNTLHFEKEQNILNDFLKKFPKENPYSSANKISYKNKDKEFKKEIASVRIKYENSISEKIILGFVKFATTGKKRSIDDIFGIRRVTKKDKTINSVTNFLLEYSSIKGNPTKIKIYEKKDEESETFYKGKHAKKYFNNKKTLLTLLQKNIGKVISFSNPYLNYDIEVDLERAQRKHHNIEAPYTATHVNVGEFYSFNLKDEEGMQHSTIELQFMDSLNKSQEKTTSKSKHTTYRKKSIAEAKLLLGENNYKKIYSKLSQIFTPKK